MPEPLKRFFGDAERAFLLTPAMIPELERKAGAGIGILCKKVFASAFSYADITETIRLGLIGGGASPEDAASLTAIYVPARPLAESYGLAVAILEHLMMGAREGEAA